MSFRLKTILGIALIEGVLLALLVVGILRFLDDASARQLHDYAKAALDNVVAVSGSQGTDLKRLQAYSDFLVANRNIAYTRILDDKGNPLVESGPKRLLNRPFRADAGWRRVRDQVFDAGEAITAARNGPARVELGIDVAPTRDAFDRTRRWSLAIAGAGGLFVILFSAVLGLYLTRQLDRLREGARRLQAGELGYQVPIRGRGELAQTAAVFNAMSRRLLDDRNESLAREWDCSVEQAAQQMQLEKLVSARTADLFEAEAQASLILESSAAGLCGLDKSGRITFLNPAACGMLGYAHDQVIGTDAHQLWHYRRLDGAPYPDWECPAGLALRKGLTSTGVEEVFWHADGHPIEVLLSTHPMTQNDGIVGAVLSFVDISERKRAEERLRAREEEYRALAENMPDNVARYDRQGRTIYANPALERMLGVRASDLIGRPAALADNAKLEYLQAIREVVETGEDRNVEIVIRRRPHGHAKLEMAMRSGADVLPTISEDIRIDQVRMVAERNAVGEVTGVLAIGRDVTELKRMQAAREGALRESERLAQVKSAFLANMSHEIRTPLNAVLGMAQIGLKESRGRKSLSRFSSILDAGQLLLGLVNDILDFSKIEAGKLKLDVDIVDLGQVIDRAVDLTVSRAWVKGLDVLVEENGPLPESFRGDALRIVQVLVNLMSNAVKFTEDGGVFLGVRLDGDSLVFTVTDTGIGMTPQQMGRLFTAFEQADGSTTRRFGGTGLGLAISKRLVDMMGGRIDSRSAPGEGTEFEFWLPASGMTMRETAIADEAVLIAGLACADTLAEALGRHGVEARNVTVKEALATPQAMAVLPYAQLEGRVLAQVREAVKVGKRVAVVTPPGSMHAVPSDLKERLHLLAWPPRARHVLRVLAAERDESEVADAPVENDLQGIRVLAAEDNELNRAVLREMLSMLGAELVCVENGRQLVDRLLQDGVSSYDIVVTDVQMPEMDGYEATRRIRELAPDMPVVGLTAHALAEERERCLASGMSAHVGKPVDMGTLASTILTLVRRRAMPAAQPSMIGAKIQPPCPDVPIDWAALEAVFPGRAEFIERLCRLLLDGHGETPARLRELAGRKESEELARLSHNLKGMTGNLMAVSVSRLANEVQQAAKAGAQDMGKLANELADAMERLLAAVTQRLARNGTDPG